ncbi:cyclin family protein [Aspergillus lucknowensis]|uniref:Cyclin-like protein n=1 Tax=Aspergillus lucknowensis TaxID=176173 RepID=A0ABR4LDZ3_9EURO
MDAKPQRIRVRGDENAPFPLAANKSLHQRNKSTTALSSAFQNSANKNGARRAAFGDVSNTTNLVHGNRDDASLAGKKSLKVLDKASLGAEKKPVTLSQPAQRPVSMSSLKGLLNNVTNPKPLEISKQPAGQQQGANIRKTLNKRATVFKDHLEPLTETREFAAKEFNNLESKEGNKKGYTRQGVAEAAQHGNVKTGPITSDEVLESELSRTEEASLAKFEVDQGDKDTSEVEDDECKVQVVMPQAGRSRELQAASELPDDKPSSNAPRGSAPASRASHDSVPHQSEPEEYWDDEDEENEEDDGYITARSYRSRGENTTGGATTLLFPRYNQQVKRELALAKQVVDATRTVEDIEDDFCDTSMVAEYSEEIFEYMREQEIKMLPNAHYMDNQAEIQWSMRSVLMDWLVQVHHRFSLLPETLFLCVNYIDRFLSCKIVSLGKLQLVGATAIFIAAKYEEINCPSVQEIVYMVDGGYTVDEILKAERFMLSMLQFELGWPGPMSFLRRISKADDYDLETRTLAKYFLEITIMDERFVGIPASFLAAGAHCLARLMLRKGTWSPAHVHYAGYTYSQLHPLISLMQECCEMPRKHHAAIYEKYTDKRFKLASLFVEAEMRKNFRLPEATKDRTSLDRKMTLESGHWKRV